VITSLRRRDIIGDKMEDLNGLYKNAPVEAVLMLIFLLSLAGIPPLAGFYGKYFIFLALIETGHYTLAAVAVGFAVIAMYYYLRLANAMFMHESKSETPVIASWGVRSALFLSAFGTIAIGLFPNIFIRAVDWSLSGVDVNSISWLR
jgi:NADH-quinone oxidoreductase subunit N